MIESVTASVSTGHLAPNWIRNLLVSANVRNGWKADIDRRYRGMHSGAMSDDAAPTLNDWVWVEAMLFQALVGRISANLRMITLRFAAGRWAVQFFLAEDNDEDKEEIDDALTYLESYLLDITDRLSPTAAAPLDFSVRVSSEDLWLEEGIQNRILFGRRERLHPS